MNVSGRIGSFWSLSIIILGNLGITNLEFLRCSLLTLDVKFVLFCWILMSSYSFFLVAGVILRFYQFL